MAKCIGKKIKFILFFIFLFSNQRCFIFANNSHEDYNLINLKKFDSKLTFDIRYASENNVACKKIYINYIPLLHHDAVLAVSNVNAILKEKGYSLVVYDAFRPIEANNILYDSVPSKIKHYFSNSLDGSNHSRGIAIDVSLLDKNHKQIPMPSEYDECNEKASIFYYGGTIESRQLRNLLIYEMEKEGFKVNSREWWHFDYIGLEENIETVKKKYPLINYNFDE